MGGFFLLVILAGAFLLAVPAAAIAALVATQQLRRDVTRLNRLVHLLETRIAALQPRAGPEAPPAGAAERPPEAVPEAAVPPAEVRAEPPPEPARREEEIAAPVPPAPAPATPREALEEKLASRWLVWLGGLAVAFAAVFLVRYSIEMGWLGPAVRCLMGAALGLMLIAAGEWLRRRPFEKAFAAIKPSQVPPALVGGGVSALFVSIYAAYALYDLLVPLVAFAGLAAVWAAAIALSLTHGWVVAALGILGGFAVPYLVQTGNPSAYALFPYLIAVSAAALAVLRFKGWGWLAWGTLAGAAIWPVIWFFAPAFELGAPAVGFYLTATAGLFVYLPSGLAPHRAPVTLSRGFAGMPQPALLAWSACGAMLVLALGLVWADDFQAGSVAWAGLLGAFLMLVGRRDETYDALSAAAGLVACLVLLTWNLPYWPGEVDVLALLPAGLAPFVTAASGYAALFGLLGLALLHGAPRPGMWAGVSAALPAAALAIAFLLIRDFEVDLTWAAMAFVLGLANLAAAWWVARRRGEAGMEGALAAYAAGVVACVSLGLTMALENAWLTVALSAQLPALAWIHARTQVYGIRILALLIAGSVLVRLVFNYQLFDYPLGATPGLNWMLYGYGLPTLAFWAAARMFRRSADDRLVLALESGALVFLTLFVTLEITDLVHGGRFVPGADLLEASLRSIAWLIIAAALLWQCRAETPRVVAVWGWRILAGMAGIQVLLIQLLERNPLGYRVDVGDWPIFNLLLLAYAAPAALALFLAGETRRQNVPSAPLIAGVSALVLVFVWLSLEVRRAFHPNFLYLGHASDAEWWAYSGVWLAYSLVLLALGILRRDTTVRYASLAVLLLTVAKVFLFDMAEIGGLFRVASFLALGLCLVAIGGLYRRYVFPPTQGAAQT